MMSAAKRRNVLAAIDQIEGHCILLRQKIDRDLSAPPLTISRLEDIEAQLSMLSALVKDAESTVKATLWRSRTGPAEWLGPKRGVAS